MILVTRLLIYKLKRRIITYLNTLAKANASESCEIRAIVEYLKKHRFSVFPYAFSEKYKAHTITVFFDGEFPYVLHDGKKLYGKRGWSKRKMQEYYNSLLLEQDEESPHCYLKDGHTPVQDSVIADIGAAEGIFSLDVMDYAQKIYLFECDETWIEALEKTLAPYKDKVEIVRKYIGDNVSESMTTLDTFFADKRIDCIKADIEGWEEAMLLGGEKTFREKIRQAWLCLYHKQSAEKNITASLRDFGFMHQEINAGYMLFIWSESELGIPFEPPYIRHGVVYAEKQR